MNIKELKLEKKKRGENFILLENNKPGINGVGLN
jgi:hypothetical protein